MGGLPVVEDLVAVLDGAIQRCDGMTSEEDIECKYGLYFEGRLGWLSLATWRC